MPVQRLSHLRPAAMQEHTLVCRADLQQLADLVCAPADEVPQGDDGTLRRRQRGNRPLDDFDRLAQERALLRELTPALRRRRPVVGPARAGAVEASAIDGELCCGDLLVAQCREGDAPALRGGARLRPVREIPKEPRLEGRAPLEALDANENSEPRLLHDLLRDRPARHVELCDPERLASERAWQAAWLVEQLGLRPD